MRARAHTHTHTHTHIHTHTHTHISTPNDATTTTHQLFQQFRSNRLATKNPFQSETSEEKKERKKKKKKENFPVRPWYESNNNIQTKRNKGWHTYKCVWNHKGHEDANIQRIETCAYVMPFSIPERISQATISFALCIMIPWSRHLLSTLFQGSSAGVVGLQCMCVTPPGVTSCTCSQAMTLLLTYSRQVSRCS